jgi:hypothetical protein
MIIAAVDLVAGPGTARTIAGQAKGLPVQAPRASHGRRQRPL